MILGFRCGSGGGGGDDDGDDGGGGDNGHDDDDCRLMVLTLRLKKDYDVKK